MKIEAFNDFWLDCTTSMLYSILLATEMVDKAYIYNNFYSYKLQKEEMYGDRKEFYSIMPINDNSRLWGHMLTDRQKVEIWSFDNPIEEIKKCMSNSEIVMLGVDLFYWLEESYHFNRNHIFHYSLVLEVDEEAKTLLVLETGIDGYQKFRIPFDNVKRAVTSLEASSCVYNINPDISNLMYTKQDIVKNAKEIIESIENVLDKKEAICWVDSATESDYMYINDILQTHIFIMENRQKVNRHLFMIVLDCSQIGIDFYGEFNELEKSFSKLKGRLLKWNCRGNAQKGIELVINEIPMLLTKEKKLWETFLQYSKDIFFNYDCS